MPATQLTRRAQAVELILFRPARTAEEIEHDRVQSRVIAASSIALSRIQAAAWLACPCGRHAAKSGDYCWPRVRGMCGERIGRRSKPRKRRRA